MRVTSVLATIVLLCTTGLAVAGDGWWAEDVDGDWSDFSNWVGGNIADGADNTAHFTVGVGYVCMVLVDGNRTIGHLKFSDAGGSGDMWQLEDRAPHRLTLSTSTGGPTITVLTESEITCPLSGTQGFTKLGGANLTLHPFTDGDLSGDVVLQGGILFIENKDPFGDNANLVVEGSGDARFFTDSSFGGLSGSGRIYIGTSDLVTVGAGDQTTQFDGQIWGWGELAKAGSGTLTLTSLTNHYDGGTTFLDGTLSVSDQTNLGDRDGNAGALTFDGGTLQITGTTFGSTTLPIILGAGGGGFDIDDPNHTFTVSQALSGNGGLWKRGSGTLTLTGDNTYTGGTTIEVGTLRLTGTDERLADTGQVEVLAGWTFHVDGITETIGALTGSGETQLDGTLRVGGGDVTCTYAGSLAAPGDLIKIGTGTLSLTGSNGPYAGTIYVNEGTLGAGINDSLGNLTDVHVASGAMLLMEDAEGWGGLSGDGEVDTNGFNIGLGNDGQSMTFDGVISGAGRVAKHGGGTMTLTGANTHTGGTLVQYGALVLRGNNSAMSGTIHVLSGCSLAAGINDSLSNQTRVTLDAGATLLIEEGEEWGSLAGGGDIELGAHSIRVGYDDTDTTLSGTITGTGVFRKAGAGTMTLSGSSDWTGGASIENGALSVSADENLGDPTGPLTFAGGNLHVTGAGFGMTSRSVTLSNPATIDVVDATNTIAVDSALAGSGDLTKLGDGTLALRGNNAAGYTGDITVSAGTLAVGISNSLGNENRVTVEAGANLLIEGDEEWGALAGGGDVDLGAYYIQVGHDGTDTTLSGAITGTGVFRKAGAGTMILSGFSDYTGGTVFDGGVLVADDDAALGSGPAQFNGGRLEVAAGVTISNALDFESLSGGTLGGDGTVQSFVTLGSSVPSTIAPGSSAGVLTIDGDYTQEALGTLLIEIGGTTPGTEYDTLAVTGTANLAGELQVTHINDYWWEAGQEYVVLTAGSVIGTFDSVVGPRMFEVTYNTDTVTISPTCSLGDLDCSGRVDLDDFDLFEPCLRGPELAPPDGCEGADLDGDGDVDLADFAWFQQEFNGPPMVIETVPVGNPGNAGEPSGNQVGCVLATVGGVDYTYNIGKYEVTAGQYAVFLNAVAASDPYGLYATGMDDYPKGCQITRNGTDGNYTYDFSGRPSGTEADWVNRPVNHVAWIDAARFCNWLHNGQPVGAPDLTTTEDGSYFIDGVTAFDPELNTITREPDATWVIPTENEWYKAAYHANNGVTGDYWAYPTGTDTVPTSQAPPGTNMTNGSANYDNPIWNPYYRTEVGAYDAKPSDSPYGTFDQGGNVWEWNDETEGSYLRWLRGGSYNMYPSSLHADYRCFHQNAHNEQDDIGFRVAEIP